jgi:hypothetical protein
MKTFFFVIGKLSNNVGVFVLCMNFQSSLIIEIRSVPTRVEHNNKLYSIDANVKQKMNTKDKHSALFSQTLNNKQFYNIDANKFGAEYYFIK